MPEVGWKATDCCYTKYVPTIRPQVDQGVDQEVAPSSTVSKVQATSSEGLVEVLQRLVSPDLYELWLSKPGRIQLLEGRVVVVAENSFEQKRLQQTFGLTLRQAAMRLVGDPSAVEFRIGTFSPAVSPAAENRTAVHRESAARQHPGLSPDNSPAPVTRPVRFRLADFAFATGDRMLQTAIEQCLESPGRFSPLYLFGGPGCGKTHLAESIAAEFRRRSNKSNRAVCITAEQFTNSFIQSLRGTGLPVFRRKFRDLDLLIVEDIQFFEGKRATLGEFQQTLDFLVRNCKQIVLTADRDVMAVAECLGDFSSRLTSGLAIHVGWPDIEGREKIVRRFSAERGLSLDDASVRLIAEEITGDARRLSGAVNRVVAASLGSGLIATQETTLQALGDLIGMKSRSVSLKSIEKAVCEFFAVTVSELKSKSRTRRISMARMMSMWLARKLTGNALSEIGNHFGTRSHSTVVAAQKRIDELLENGEVVEFAGRVCTMAEAATCLQRRLQGS